MKITVKQLKALIREAVFAEPVKLGVSKHETSAADSTESVRITKLAFDAGEYEDVDHHRLSFPRLKVYFSSRAFGKRFEVHAKDPKFIKDLRKTLLTLGFSDSAVRAVNYGPGYMQGSNFVGMVAGPKFMSEWYDLVGARSIEL